MTHKVGDVLFFTVDGVAGEGTYIGNMKADPGAVILAAGKQPVDIDASACNATGRSYPAEGRVGGGRI